MEGIRPITHTLAVVLGLVLAGLPMSVPAAPATGTGSHATPARVLPFIEDDYPRAVAEAKTRQVPLFIESWAPW
jgi:hypothetical protein